MNLVGIAGRAGAGKSTAASVLVKEFGFIEVALADPLKRICKEVFDFSDEQLWGPSEKRNELDERYPLGGNGVGFLSPRYALQTLGTEWGRGCYEDVWIDIAIRTAQKLLGGDIGIPEEYDPKRGLIYAGNYNPPEGVVISDIRFPNEVAAIKKAGGTIWLIERPKQSRSVLRREAMQKGEPLPDFQSHVSENSLDGIKVNGHIDNRDTLDWFKEQVRTLARSQL